LQAALESSEGKGVTFYSMLNLTKEATAQQIKTAYRKRSIELQ
jgi:DnaJ-class molecular chaperone